MKSLLPALVLLVLVTACGSDPVPETSTGTTAVAPPFLHGLADRLVGEWSDVLEADATVFNEHWQRDGEARLSGIGFVLSGNDTISIEYLAIERTDLGTFYTARIPSQNNGMPVSFRLTSTTSDSLVFEAPEHDFPQRIVYVPITPDRWHVDVSGTASAEMRVMHFQFERSKGAAQLP